MKYYKADITVVEGEKTYGNLPPNFVIGYENLTTNEAIFPLQDECVLPEDPELVELTQEEFNTELAALNAANNAIREAEIQAAIENLIEKENRITTLEAEVADLKDRLGI